MVGIALKMSSNFLYCPAHSNQEKTALKQLFFLLVLMKWKN